MSKKKDKTGSRKKNLSYDYESTRNKKFNKLHPRSESSKHKHDFIDWDLK